MLAIRRNKMYLNCNQISIYSFVVEENLHYIINCKSFGPYYMDHDAFIEIQGNGYHLQSKKEQNSVLHEIHKIISKSFK